MSKKNLTTLIALALVTLAVPAFAEDPLGDYEDTFAEGGPATLSLANYDVDTEEFSWFFYEAPEGMEARGEAVMATRGVDCRDTDEGTVIYFDNLLD